MRRDRLWLLGVILVLAGLLVYALSPLLELFLVFLRQGMNLLLALPQIVWWLIGIIIMIVWGLRLVVQLGKRLFPSKPQPQPAPQFRGRMGELIRSLYEARRENYSQDKVRQLLSSLAIDLISLRLDISEEEARKLYFRGDWTENEIVKAYFDKEKDGTSKNRRRLPRWFRNSKPSSFLKETGQVLNRLTHYSREA